jgi:hypothetical protein
VAHGFEGRPDLAHGGGAGLEFPSPGDSRLLTVRRGPGRGRRGRGRRGSPFLKVATALVAAREVVEEARALEDERLDLDDVLVRLAVKILAYDQATTTTP